MSILHHAHDLIDALTATGTSKKQAWRCVLVCLSPWVSRADALDTCDDARGLDSDPDPYVLPAAERLISWSRPWARR